MDDALQSFNLTNYRPHPTSDRHVVFFFKDLTTADEFEGLLKKEGIGYERDEEEGDEGQVRYLFGVRRHELEAAKTLNYTAIGLHRKSFISDPIIKWVTILIFFIALAMALIGFIKSGGNH